jgi:hypothetical protein
MADRLIEEIILKIGVDTGNVDNDLDDASDSMDDFTESTENSSSSLSVWGAALAAAAGAAGLGLMVKNQAEAIGEMDAFAKKLGVGTQSFMELNAVAERFGLTTQDVGQGLKNVNERLADAELMQTGAAFDAIRILGLDLEKINKLGAEDKFLEIADALSRVEDEATRTFLSLELGEEEFFKLGEVISMGKDGIIEAKEEARRLTGVLSDLEVSNIRDMNIAANEMSIAFHSIFTEITANVAPVLEEMFDITSDIFVLFRDEGLPVIGEWTAIAATAFLDFVNNILPSLLTVGNAVFTGLSQLLIAMADVAGQVFGAVGTGWGLLSEEITGDSNWIEQITGILSVAAQAWPEIIAKPFLLIGEMISNFLASLEDRFFGAFDTIRKEGLAVANALDQITDEELEAGIIAIDVEAREREDAARTGFTQFFQELAQSQRQLIDENNQTIQEIADKTASDQEKFRSLVGDRVNDLKDAIKGVSKVTSKIGETVPTPQRLRQVQRDVKPPDLTAIEAGSKEAIKLAAERERVTAEDVGDVQEKQLKQEEKQTQLLKKIESKDPVQVVRIGI